jgi:hypothetical protein
MNAPLLYAILALWSVFGFIYYMAMMSDVKGYKSVILLIVAGPMIWFIYIFTVIFSILHNWLTKE